MAKIGFTLAGIMITALIMLYMYSWLFVDVRPHWCHVTIICLWCGLSLLQFISLFFLDESGGDGLY